MGSLCNPKGDFPAETLDTDVPYHLYCMCHCQPYFKVDAAVAASAEPPACVAFSRKEQEQVDKPDGKDAENCEDPKFPTQMEQNKMGKKSPEDLAKEAKVAGTPAPKAATAELTAQTKAVEAAAKEAARQAEAAKAAAGNAKELLKNPILKKAAAQK